MLKAAKRKISMTSRLNDSCILLELAQNLCILGDKYIATVCGKGLRDDIRTGTKHNGLNGRHHNFRGHFLGQVTDDGIYKYKLSTGGFKKWSNVIVKRNSTSFFPSPYSMCSLTPSSKAESFFVYRYSYFHQKTADKKWNIFLAAGTSPTLRGVLWGTCREPSNCP